jgi:hypothetical protein
MHPDAELESSKSHYFPRSMPRALSIGGSSPVSVFPSPLGRMTATTVLILIGMGSNGFGIERRLQRWQLRFPT